MKHRMGLVGITLASTSVDKIRYYISAPSFVSDANYTWYSAKQTVYASKTYGSSSLKPYQESSYQHYYIAKTTGSSQFTTTDELASGRDAGNNWTETITNSTIGSGNYKTITKTPSTTYLQRTGYTLALGDVFYSDGSVSKPGAANLYAGKTPIGVVVFIPANDTEKQWAEPTHNGGHALIMALTNYGNSTTGYYMDTSISGGYPVWSGKPSVLGTSWTNDKSGYTNCYTYLNKTTNPASYYCMRHTPSAPSTSSGWFLPTAGQWFFTLGRLVGESDATITGYSIGTQYTSNTSFSTLNNYLSNSGASYQKLINTGNGVSGGQYWTSSSYTNGSSTSVYYQYFVNGLYIAGESNKRDGDEQNLVRPFLAF